MKLQLLLHVLFCFWSSDTFILLLVVAMFKTKSDISSIFMVIFGGGAGEQFYITAISAQVTFFLMSKGHQKQLQT